MSELSKIKYLKFELCGTPFALALADVREVLPMAKLTVPPQMPSFIEGFLNLASVPIPVFRLDRILELNGQAPTADSHLILIKREQAPFIILVDRVREVFSADAQEHSEVREHLSLNKCVSSQIHVQTGAKSESVQILTIDALLVEQERKLVTEYSAIQQKRLLESWKVVAWAS